MMIDRLEGNSELKTSVRLMLGGRRMTHSVLLVGEEGLGTGFAARCVAADYLYPNGGAPAEALLRGECCRAVAKAGKRDSGQIETGIVREAISVTGMGSGGGDLGGQGTANLAEADDHDSHTNAPFSSAPCLPLGGRWPRRAGGREAYHGPKRSGPW